VIRGVSISMLFACLSLRVAVQILYRLDHGWEESC